MACLLSAQQLSFTLANGATLFSNISANFTNRLCAVVGINGVGKSVLGQCLSGQLATSNGHVHCDGVLAYVPQSWPGAPTATLTEVFGLTAALAAIARIEQGTANEHDFEMAEPWWDWPQKIQSALLSTGLKSLPDMTRTIGSFSGGEQFRLMWASALLKAPDFFIFDEPSNHLDQKGRQQFEAWLNGVNAQVMLITHDRHLLNLVECIYELTPNHLHRHPGNYRDYMSGKEQRWQTQQTAVTQARRQQKHTQQKAQQALEKAQQRSARGKSFAERTNMDKMARDGAKQAAENSLGQQKLMRQSREQNQQARVETATEQLEWFDPIGFELPGSQVPDRKQVLTLKQFQSGINHPLHAPIDVQLSGAFRLHLQGVNGSGKSVFIKTLMNQLPTIKGHGDIHVPFAHLDQHFHHFDPTCSAVENFLTVQPSMTDREARDRLAWLRLRNTKADVPFGALSGGEQLKVVLAAQLLGVTTPQLLILDEPTNHLDLDSLLALENALSVYRGAMIVISHDHEFVRRMGITHELMLPSAEINAL